MADQVKGWEFAGAEGDFVLQDADRSSYLYFPLANEAGMMSSITPNLSGDIKAGQNSFFMEPVSSENLHDRRSTRDLWVSIEGDPSGKPAGKVPPVTHWSCAGNSPAQIARRHDDSSPERMRVEAGILWHRVVRSDAELGVEATVESFCPMTGDMVELDRFRIKNTGKKPLAFTATSAFPIYGRSADNYRDHRHVTSLLHRIRVGAKWVEVRPSLSFDERGHRPNGLSYFLLGATGSGEAPLGAIPVTEDFIGEGGSWEWPRAVARPEGVALSGDGARFDGFEAAGALRFPRKVLAPGEEASFVFCCAIRDLPEGAEKARDDAGRELSSRYLSDAAFDKLLGESREEWRRKLSMVKFELPDAGFGPWMRWVAVQPILRRLLGCSFLPHHDYGRGGRGWRDLWQDCLALLLMEPGPVRGLLLNNFAGVRMDGSNATIIGAGSGNFIADRNNIARSWMDHGAWPLLTAMLYVDLSGDLGFLLEEQAYFKDKLIRRSKSVDPEWRPEQGSVQLTGAGGAYSGSVLEHLVVQNLTQFYNVGKRNCLRLEDADWNDGIDMAHPDGESVAFTSFYAWNLARLSEAILLLAERKGMAQLEVAEELLPLFDRASGAELDYGSVEAKRGRLEAYWKSVSHAVSGRKVKIDAGKAAADLMAKAEWMRAHLRKQEIVSAAGERWFNGYYDGSGRRVEGDFPGGPRMTLTGQVFALMGMAADDGEARQAARAARKFLLDPKVGGYRLNTDFGELKLDFGRCFGFAFGHKENGAVFSHMAIMWGNALYRRGLVKEGEEAMRSLYDLARDFPRSRIYPGLPEYFNERRRGMYHYLTGSASWLLLTWIAEVYGVRGKLGDLELAPALLPAQYAGGGRALARTLFAGRTLDVVFRNPEGLVPAEGRVVRVAIDGKEAAFRAEGGAAVLARGAIEALGPDGVHEITATIGR